MSKLESAYRGELIRRLEKLFPGCVIIQNDPSAKQGIPDLLILYNTMWAMLEVKRSANAPKRPNQEYWIDYYHEVSFAKFIYPENEEEVLFALQQAFGADR